MITVTESRQRCSVLEVLGNSTNSSNAANIESRKLSVPNGFAPRLVPDQVVAVAPEADGEYRFQGRHLMASYMGCDLERLLDTSTLLQVFKDAADATGATVLDACHYVFPGNGLTAVLLLSESHASIHTYPENHSCFVDLFTCGDTVDQSKFDQAMRHYLKPHEVNQNVFNREQAIEHIE